MRILVIEDDPRVASFIRRGLAADKLVVDVAQEGEPGLDLALSKDRSLIILARSQVFRHSNNVIVRRQRKLKDIVLHSL